jgi:hypothetical protein
MPMQGRRNWAGITALSSRRGQDSPRGQDSGGAEAKEAAQEARRAEVAGMGGFCFLRTAGARASGPGAAIRVTARHAAGLPAPASASSRPLSPSLCAICGRMAVRRAER